MIASSSHQAWLFYSPLARQAAQLKDDLLDPVDRLLDDPALVDLVDASVWPNVAPVPPAPGAWAWPPIVCCAAVS